MPFSWLDGNDFRRRPIIMPLVKLAGSEVWTSVISNDLLSYLGEIHGFKDVSSILISLEHQ